AVATAAAAALVASCFGVHPRDGAYSCYGDDPCPTGYLCAADHTCRRSSSMPSALVLAPDPAWVPAGTQQRFTVAGDVAVDWSAAGGPSSADGTFRAPPEPGTYAVVAVERAAPNRRGSATVHVVPRSLELVAGRLGGPGGADGTRDDARFWGALAVVSDGA